jgi:tetratricopeptide (TPR) repeat protein
MLAKGARLGPYEVVELIGSGGMGEVYRALDTRLGRAVAIKVLPAHLASRTESLTRFRREARAIAALSHPNIVAVFDIGSQADTPYVVTELLAGQTLRSRMHGGALSLDEALRIAAAIAEGLGAAHAKGIIHRDLKPENVFLTTDGGVKILDFGLASTEPLLGPAESSAGTQMLTEPGVIIGTIGYMAPEQLHGTPLTAAADVFSFGCLTFEMLDGQMPFQRDSQVEVVAAVLRDDPFERDEPLAMPDEVRELIEDCLRKNPAERPQNGGEIAEALRAMVAAHEGGKLATAPTLRIRRWQQTKPRRRVLFFGAMALFVALIAIVTRTVIARNEVLDEGYDLRAGDVTGNREARRLLALALHADAVGRRAESIELFREAARADAEAPLPPAFLSAFVDFSGDPKSAARWSAETKRRLGTSSPTYERLLSRFLLPENDSTAMMTLASSALALRPNAWRLRLSLAHRHLDRREMKPMLAHLMRIDVSAPDDRRLALVLADRASLGDIDGATRDLQRSRLTSRPALLAYTRGRIEWSRGNATQAAKLFDEAADRASLDNLLTIAADSRVLAGVARIRAGDLAGAQLKLDEAAVKARQASLPSLEFEAYVFAAYVAQRLGDPDGVRRRAQRAAAIAIPGTSNDAALRLFMLRVRLPVVARVGILEHDADVLDGVDTLLEAREAWSRGEVSTAQRLLRQARSEGVDDTWFAEEAALLDHDLGAPAPARALSQDPPYPNRSRLIAVWELERANEPR